MYYILKKLEYVLYLILITPLRNTYCILYHIVLQIVYILLKRFSNKENN